MNCRHLVHLTNKSLGCFVLGTGTGEVHGLLELDMTKFLATLALHAFWDTILDFWNSIFVPCCMKFLKFSQSLLHYEGLKCFFLDILRIRSCKIEVFWDVFTSLKIYNGKLLCVRLFWFDQKNAKGYIPYRVELLTLPFLRKRECMSSLYLPQKEKKKTDY